MADEQQPDPGQDGYPIDLDQLMASQALMLVAMVPGTTQEAALAALQRGYAMEANLQEVYQYLFEGTEPKWGLYLERRPGLKGQPLHFFAPHHFAGNLNPADIGTYLLIVGVLTSPISRALLILTGWRIQIGPLKETPSPKIIVPG